MNTYEISVIDLIRILLKKWYIIVLSTLLLAAGGLVYAKLQTTPSFELTGRLELESDKLTINDTLKILEDRHYVARVVKERTGCKYSVRQITSMYNIMISPSGKDIDFELKYGEKPMLEEVMKEYMNVFAEELGKIVDDVHVKKITVGELKEKITYGSKKKNLVYGAAIGAAGSVALICAWYVLRETLLNRESIESALGAVSLGKLGKSVSSLGNKDDNSQKKDIETAVSDIKLHRSQASMIGFVSAGKDVARDGAVKFANTLALEGKKVLFIDNNADLLHQEDSVKEINDKIYYLNSKYLGSDPAEKLEQLKKEYDVIVCSSDQLLDDECSRICAAAADSVICLIRENRETGASIRAIKEKLDYINARCDGYMLVK